MYGVFIKLFKIFIKKIIKDSLFDKNVFIFAEETKNQAVCKRLINKTRSAVKGLFQSAGRRLPEGDFA